MGFNEHMSLVKIAATFLPYALSIFIIWEDVLFKTSALKENIPRVIIGKYEDPDPLINSLVWQKTLKDVLHALEITAISTSATLMLSDAALGIGILIGSMILGYRAWLALFGEWKKKSESAHVLFRGRRMDMTYGVFVRLLGTGITLIGFITSLVLR